MLDKDFFGFCTTLRPLELKAIGELSKVQHLGEGETVYSTGDPGDALFIIIPRHSGRSVRIDLVAALG